MSFRISSAFDSGNILVLCAENPADVRLEIRRDVGDEHLQWFYFRVSGACGRRLRLRLTNAASTSYPAGWEGYRACASSDRKSWTRVVTSYVDGELIIEHEPSTDVTYFAYFAPYTLEQHHDLIARCASHPLSRVEWLGPTVEGRDLDLVRIGSDASDAKRCWIIARQHPGETMAEWLVDGLLERLLDADDPLAKELRERAAFFIVPNVNPDGSVRGHLRSNARGANLNREWSEPSEERSPEVVWIQRKMLETGVDFALDVHGDEALPHNFIAGADGVASLPPAVHEARERYERALMQANPDFQTTVGYPRAAPGKANLRIATNWIAAQFGALSMTLEQPFKDVKGRPHPDGWSPSRAQLLGRANLDALFAVLDDL